MLWRQRYCAALVLWTLGRVCVHLLDAMLGSVCLLRSVAQLRRTSASTSERVSSLDTGCFCSLRIGRLEVEYQSEIDSAQRYGIADARC
jgi:hypothetical protein